MTDETMKRMRAAIIEATEQGLADIRLERHLRYRLRRKALKLRARNCRYMVVDPYMDAGPTNWMPIEGVHAWVKERFGS
jgi:hypothetical protein